MPLTIRKAAAFSCIIRPAVVESKRQDLGGEISVFCRDILDGRAYNDTEGKRPFVSTSWNKLQTNEKIEEKINGHIDDMRKEMHYGFYQEHSG